MIEVRSGESDKVWFRSQRFLQIDNKWYFLTRECTQEGPFDSREEAERELNYYIRQQNQSDVFQGHEQQGRAVQAK